MHPTVKRNTMNKSNLSKLDPTVYLDTQSNGFASRVVKYYEASEAKSRPISNQSYRRPGDFPIVNLEKSELSLNQRKENIPKISKLNIAPPINLVSHASARSAIFRTGKNYGETIGPIVKGNNDSNNTTSSNKSADPLPSAAAHDEPIVSNESDYNAASARSSLDALKEISRKRIRCEVSFFSPIFTFFYCVSILFIVRSIRNWMVNTIKERSQKILDSIILMERHSVWPQNVQEIVFLRQIPGEYY